MKYAEKMNRITKKRREEQNLICNTKV
jgi:hypothetical protein